MAGFAPIPDATAQTYLKRARGRGGVLVETDAQATSLLLDARRCTGVPAQSSQAAWATSCPH